MGIRAHPRLTSGKTSKAIMAPSLLVAPGRPFVHLFIPSRRPRRVSCRYSSYSVSVLMLRQSGHVKPSPRSHRRSLAPGGERGWRRGMAGIPLVNLSEPGSRDIGDDPRLIGAAARENRPNDAGELVGERDRQQVAVQPPRCLLDPRPQAPTLASTTCAA